MEVREAMERLDAIHEHLTRSEEYRGFRTAGVALTGLIGLGAAAVQADLAGGSDSFVSFWVRVAAICGAVSAGPAIYSYLVAEDEFTRRRTRRVLGQFVPCVLVGAVVTAVLTRVSAEVIPCLPGVWALLFGLGMVSARPYLPLGMGAVAAFYLLAGSLLLMWGASHAEPSGWAVGGVFGPGHLAAACVLARGQGEDHDG